MHNLHRLPLSMTENPNLEIRVLFQVNCPGTWINTTKMCLVSLMFPTLSSTYTYT